MPLRLSTGMTAMTGESNTVGPTLAGPFVEHPVRQSSRQHPAIADLVEKFVDKIIDRCLGDIVHGLSATA